MLTSLGSGFQYKAEEKQTAERAGRSVGGRRTELASDTYWQHHTAKRNTSLGSVRAERQGLHAPAPADAAGQNPGGIQAAASVPDDKPEKVCEKAKSRGAQPVSEDRKRVTHVRRPLTYNGFFFLKLKVLILKRMNFSYLSLSLHAAAHSPAMLTEDALPCEFKQSRCSAR